jgi:hypothetical protein
MARLVASDVIDGPSDAAAYTGDDGDEVGGEGRAS